MKTPLAFGIWLIMVVSATATTFNDLPYEDPGALEGSEFRIPDPPMIDIPDLPELPDSDCLCSYKFEIEHSGDSIILYEYYIFNWDDDGIHPDVYGARIPILEISRPPIPDLKYEEEIVSIGDLNKNAPYISQ